MESARYTVYHSTEWLELVEQGWVTKEVFQVDLDFIRWTHWCNPPIENRRVALMVKGG